MNEGKKDIHVVTFVYVYVGFYIENNLFLSKMYLSLSDKIITEYANKSHDLSCGLFQEMYWQQTVFISKHYLVQNPSAYYNVYSRTSTNCVWMVLGSRIYDYAHRDPWVTKCSSNPFLYIILNITWIFAMWC